MLDEMGKRDYYLDVVKKLKDPKAEYYNC